jgi:predicted nucleotidyltransferase
MALSAEKKLIFKALRRESASLPRVELAYAYGSFVKGKEFRDLDVAVRLRPPSNRRADTWKLREEMASRLEKTIPHGLRRPVDCHILDEMPLALQHRVISEGKCLYAQSEKLRVLYEERVLNDYLDFQPALERFNRETLTRWSSAHA